MSNKSSTPTSTSADTHDRTESIANPTYVESTVIMTTVRLVVPFIFTFGLFVMFHGADSAGGGFQGGVIVASTVLLLAFAFGIDATRRWIEGPLIRTAIATGSGLFIIIGLGSILVNGQFLEYAAYDIGTTGIKYGIELVELGIGSIVSGVLIGLFYTLARGDMLTQGDITQPSPQKQQENDGS
ncbi:Na(+)/H(+) antiporter subunit B [Haloquadratum walsbyi]|jgi:Multisubunit Na+/H+ antiporter, MnhB subunit|uniref:Multisubunit Na+/H+ antiporter, MnhB subunit n=1 Tax=Haloquadratum walsbyi J07HQW2 TaxID=1238425 RepID=U1PW93_9EURY|nr:Na(+)/H(+) antiporter subunit B [Haloquadratum walsbyi]ERG96706.1 MAG: multisubunit Na+/H+ antiporter, MnhB subunit [Haloquadratum walsbyi J07HQW2]